MSKKLAQKPAPQAKIKPATVRIIAGEYRRRLIGFVDAQGLRPTPDRVRETVFNWLNEALINATVLDCCAGSGVLGFESLSRGARHVTLIEPNPMQVKQLHTTKQQLNIAPQQLTIVATTAQDAIDTLQGQPAFDVVFIDPPYALNLWQTLLQQLLQAALITTNTLIYIEADLPHERILTNYWETLTPLKHKKMGQIYCAIYQFTELPL